MLRRIIDVTYAKPEPEHRARDTVDLRDPLLLAIHRAERANERSLATPEQTLAEMVLKLRMFEPKR